MKQLSLSLCVALMTVQAEGQPGTRRDDPFLRYALDITVDPDGRQLEGRGELWIPASNEPRESIRIGFAKNMHGLTVEVLEPEASAGTVSIEQGSPQGNANNESWLAKPARPFAAGQSVHLRLTWHGGQTSSSVFYLGPEGSFASGINSAWYPVLDEGVASGTLRITVPAGLTVHANGLRRGTPEEQARGVFRYESATPSFFAFVAGKYTVVRREGAIPVSVYLLKPRTGVDAYVDGCRKTIDVLTEEFGAYPSGEFAVVETPEAPSRAAGFTGASVPSFIMVTSGFLDRPFNLAYYGHEIAHQWWGNLIRRTGPLGRMMLDEAMAQYGSLRVVDTLAGADAAERYRRTGYPGYIESQSGLGYLKVVAAGKDFPLSNIPNDASRSLADGKGFQVWDLLSRTVGRDEFRHILHDFAGRHAFQRVTWEEFLTSIERGAGRNLQWFYDQWFDRVGAPEWQLSWRQEGQTVRGEITQSPPYYRASLEVQVESQDRRRQSVIVETNGPKTEFTVHVTSAAQSVMLDPHYQVLRWTPEYRAAVSQRTP